MTAAVRAPTLRLVAWSMEKIPLKDRVGEVGNDEEICFNHKASSTRFSHNEEKEVLGGICSQGGTEDKKNIRTEELCLEIGLLRPQRKKLTKKNFKFYWNGDFNDY